MTLKQWLDNRWLDEAPTSPDEVANLLAIVNRDIEDAQGSISDDWRFGIAYNAALKLCTILLRAEGYRAAHGLQHYRTIMSLPLILGKERAADATYLDACRVKRNKVEYDYVGGASKRDADELLLFVKELKTCVIDWLGDRHPNLLLEFHVYPMKVFPTLRARLAHAGIKEHLPLECRAKCQM